MFNLISPVRAVKMEGSLFTKENTVFKILLDYHGNIFTFWRFNLYT